MSAKVTIYLSVPEAQHTMNEQIILKTLVDSYNLTNVTKFKSTVRDKSTGKIGVENGFKIEFLETTPTSSTSMWPVFNFWVKIRTKLRLNCCWVEASDYEGCINKMDDFRRFCKAENYLCGDCSEY
ncbi:MAG: hypothetical protein ACLFUH_00895 [Bacteroidales bacterium]